MPIEAEPTAEAARGAEEQSKAEQGLVQWQGEKLTKTPTKEQIYAAIEDSASVLCHSGNRLDIIAFVAPTGVALEWKPRFDEPYLVICAYRNDKPMFFSRKSAGRHGARLSPGRYELEFRVYFDGWQSTDNPDVAFEIFIPDGKTIRPADHYKNAVDSKTQEFTNRAKIASQAKKRVEDALVANTNDPEEIAAEMGRFEYELSQLNRAEGTEE
jgi:hypothetical protein